ncbi:MAG: hypothetical protein ACUZ77_02635 [Candidatus Brocadiales bacterium]
MKMMGIGKLRGTGLLSKAASSFVVISFLFIACSGTAVRGQDVGDLQKEIQSLKQRLESLEAVAEKTKPAAPPEEKIKKLSERVEVLESERARPPAVAARADLKVMVDEMWASYQKKREKEKLFSVSVHGVAKNWAITQNKFRFGKDEIRDTYVVSLFRVIPEVSTLGGDVKFVGRFDIAQGWWGVDNARGTFIDWQGDNRNSSNLFSSKETNYAFHADWAYIDFRVPFISKDFLTRAKVGRMWFGVGNKLVLDYDYEGFQTVTKHGAHTLTLGWAKVSEGYMGLSDRGADDRKWDALSMGAVSGNDTNLWMVKHEYVLPEKRGRIEGYYIHYNDAGTDDGTAYLRDQIDYSVARFGSQIGKLHVIGSAIDYKIGKLALKVEGSYLFGRDNNDNTTFNSSGIPIDADLNGKVDRDTRQSFGTAGNSASGATAIPGYLAPHFFNRLDKNNGNIRGWNAYLNAKYNDAFDAGKPGLWYLTPGLVAGAGSGDDDPTRGRGNVNKIQTEGWFYVSEVWEDSIMPDLTGITPQGLGSPWSRGYREFENQILVQPNITWKFHPKWDLFLSYQYVWAMERIYAWAPDGGRLGSRLWTDGNGRAFSDEAAARAALNGLTPGVAWADEREKFEGGIDRDRSSRDIGQEFDYKLSYHIFSNLTFDLRGGIFLPGRAASFLIAGADSWNAAAWEGRWDITFKF